MPYLYQIRRAVASDLDDLLLVSVLTATSINLVSAFQLATLETGLSAHRYDGRYLYHMPATFTQGQQRRVSKGSYVPGTGGLTVQPGWKPPAEGESLELTALFPCDAPPFTADTSYRSLINGAARKLVLGDRMTLSITTSQIYTLPTWLTRSERLKAVWEPSPFGTAPISADWRGWKIVRDGGANLLIFDVPFAVASGVLSLDVERPADTLIAPAGSGTFADSTTGLFSDGDQISPQIELTEIVACAKAEAAEVLANRGDDPTWRKTWVSYLQVARSQPHYQREAESPAAQMVPDQVAA